MHIGMPLLFLTYGGYFVASVQHGCFLFSQFTLVSGVLLMQESTVNNIARFLHVGKTFAKKIPRIYMYRNTVPPNGRLVKKEVTRNNKQPC